MYTKIMIPVDLAHADKIEKAMMTAADLSKHYEAEICIVGVTTETPSAVAHNPDEFAQKLESFTAEQRKKLGVEIEALALTSHDPVRDLDDVLGKAIKDLEVDLVIMASHVPTFADHVFSSNAGYLAAHTETSIFIVR